MFLELPVAAVPCVSGSKIFFPHWVYATNCGTAQGGIVLLDEWSYWIKSEEIKAETAVGYLLQLDEEGGVGKQADKLKAKKVGNPTGRVSAADVAAKKAKKAAAKAAKDEADAAAEALEEKTSGNFEGFSAPPNSFGFACGSSATKDLQKFMACFESMCPETPEGDAARAEGFELADPNGNGLCSLAELEGYMQKKLMAMYPKKKKTDPDVAMDLFDAFRPSYIRAFKVSGGMLSGGPPVSTWSFAGRQGLQARRRQCDRRHEELHGR